MTVQIIRSAAIIGAGYMGGGIAQSLAAAGMRVTLADVSPEATQRALERLLAEARAFEDQGLIVPGSHERIMSNLTTASSIEDAVRDVDFIEEAVFEREDVKKRFSGVSVLPHVPMPLLVRIRRPYRCMFSRPW